MISLHSLSKDYKLKNYKGDNNFAFLQIWNSLFCIPHGLNVEKPILQVFAQALFEFGTNEIANCKIGDSQN